MWAMWLVCLALTPGARALQRLTSLQVGMISYVRIASLVAFLWIVLAWLWPDRRLRNRMLALTVVLAFGVQVLTSLALDNGDWLVSTQAGRGHSGAGSGDPGVLSLAHRRRQPCPAPAQRHRRPVAVQHRRCRRGDPARPGPRCLADQLGLRAPLVGGAQCRLCLRGQRLHHAACPATSTYRGDPDPADGRLRPAARHRRVPRRGVHLRRPAAEVARVPAGDLGRAQPGAVDLAPPTASPAPSRW